jgi:hypothetical protein
MERVGHGLQIQELFDVVVGTSTGTYFVIVLVIATDRL